MPITQTLLTQKSASYRELLHEDLQKRASLGATKSAFLCHSHKDELLVKGLIALFQEAGIDLYIDWKDHAMPDTPNAETARRIQNAIRLRSLFLFLATANSKASRWCPWEIGYADSSSRNIIVIPTADEANTYGNEYLQLYARIDTGVFEAQRGLAIFRAGSTSGDWLRTGTLP